MRSGEEEVSNTTAGGSWSIGVIIEPFAECVCSFEEFCEEG